MQKVTMYKLSDGTTVDSYEHAKKQQAAIDVVDKIGPALERFGANGKEIARGVVNALITAGWRPPVRKYAKRDKASPKTKPAPKPVKGHVFDVPKFGAGK